MRLLRRMIPAAILLALVSTAAPSQAGVAPILVDADATGLNDGTTWANAYTDLQDALAAATNPAEIWVAEGVYHPTDGLNESITFALETGVALYGGFAGNETERTARDPAVNETALSGAIDIEGAQSWHVVTASGVDATAVLDGFTITAGQAGGAGSHDNGGGIYAPDGSPTLANLVITGNSARGRGGGLYTETGALSLVNIVFERNVAGDDAGAFFAGAGSFTLDASRLDGNVAADFGGAIYADENGTLAITRTSFAGNTAGGFGGALYVDSGSSSTVATSLFAHNTATHGGAVAADSDNVAFASVTFSGNVAHDKGGAVKLDTTGTSPTPFTNATFASNRARVAGGAIFEDGEGGTLVRQSITWGNTPDQFAVTPAVGVIVVERNLIQGGCPTGTTCTPADILAADPLLQPFALNGGLTESHALPAGSPAIDAGDNAACATTDQRGTTRPVDGNLDGTATCDFGAFEFTPGISRASFTTAASSGAESTTTVKLTVSLSEPSATPVSVKFRTAGGTAKGGGTDYSLTTGTLVFPARSTSRQIAVKVTNDRIDEPAETVLVRLFSPSGVTLGDVTLHTRAILDDDPRRACRGRLATVVGTTGGDTLTGMNGPDVIVALGGNDAIDGGAGDDLVCAGGGNDRVTGGSGNDLALGGPGGDTLRGGDGDDDIYGGAGRDRLEGQAGTGDVCDGGPGTDATPGAHGCEATAGVP